MSDPKIEEVERLKRRVADLKFALGDDAGWFDRAMKAEQALRILDTTSMQAINKLRKALAQVRDWLIAESTDFGYGYFPGGDPRDFEPDLDSVKEGELAAWKAACAAWDKADEAGDLPPSPESPACQVTKGGFITFGKFGVGRYSITDERMKQMADLCNTALEDKK